MQRKMFSACPKMHLSNFLKSEMTKGKYWWSVWKDSKNLINFGFCACLKKLRSSSFALTLKWEKSCMLSNFASRHIDGTSLNVGGQKIGAHCVLLTVSKNRFKSDLIQLVWTKNIVIFCYWKKVQCLTENITLFFWSLNRKYLKNCHFTTRDISLIHCNHAQLAFANRGLDYSHQINAEPLLFYLERIPMNGEGNLNFDYHHHRHHNRCQFHQHYTRAFFVRTSFQQLFSSNMYIEKWRSYE